MDLERVLKQRIEELSAIRDDPAEGVTRLLYTDSWLAARKYAQSQVEAFGLEAQLDEVGNLFHRVVRTKFPQETILTGSHIDTVVSGGTLDGQYGVIASMMVVQYLSDRYRKSRRSLEMLSMAEEEGSRLPAVFWGDKNVVGETKREEVVDISDNEDKKFVGEMHRQGFDFRQGQAKRENIETFVEVRIEQGSILESEKLQVGIVHSIIGQYRCTANLKGQANHAGTTSTSYRHDTMYGFTKICAEIIDRTDGIGDPLALTLGEVTPKPNTVNVVPGEVEFAIGYRHTDAAFLRHFTDELEGWMKTIAQELGLTVAVDRWMDEAPVPMNQAIVEVVEQKAKEDKYQYRMMHSDAGRDSQIIALRYPTAMIFVSSIGRINHNPTEMTAFPDLAEGVELLADTLCGLAHKQDRKGRIAMGYRNNRIGYQKRLLTSRAVIRKDNYAIIPHNGLIQNAVPGLEDVDVSVLRSPKLGATFMDYIATFHKNGQQATDFGGDGIQTLVYVIDGRLRVSGGQETHESEAGGYAYFTPEVKIYLASAQGADAEVFLYEKCYQSLAGHRPYRVIGSIYDQQPKEYEGMTDALLWGLLSKKFGFDTNMHILSFEPGASRAYIGTHTQEHGAYSISSQGMYNLDNEWYPVEKGDYISMSAYVPQATYAVGRKGPLMYVYSGDVNREPEL